MLRRMLVIFGVAILGLAGLARAEEPYPYQDDGNQGDTAGGDQLQEQGQVYPDEGQGGVEPSAGASAEGSAGASAGVSVDLPAPDTSVSFESFHDALAPYGEWVNVAPYGRVWRPLRVQADWRPYYYGHWEWTDEGWLWVSDEPWGWAPYHYGRWTVSSALGWFWVPGYQWAPAWVSWRFSGAVVGWAPLLPGFSVYMNAFPDYYASYYTFVPFRRFVGVSVHSVAYAPRYGGRIFRDTRPAPPRAVFRPGIVAPAWGGPTRLLAEQRVGRPIAPARIVPVSSPDHVRSIQGRGEIPVYRPGSHAGVGPGPARPGWNRPRGPGGASFPGQRPGMAPPAPGGHSNGPGRGPHGGTFAPNRGGGFAPQGGSGQRGFRKLPEERIRY